MDCVGYMFFMGVDWLQGGGFVDDGVVWVQLGGFGKIVCVSYVGFFVGGGQNIQWFFQCGDVDIVQGVENKGEKVFYIGCVEVVEFVIVFGEGEWVVCLVVIIEWYGIGMFGEQQVVGVVFGVGQQIEFMVCIWYWLYFDVEVEIVELVGQ